jgi:anti-anti-sigma factor
MPDVRYRLDGIDGRTLVLSAPPVVNHQNADALAAMAERWLPNRDDAAAVLDLSAVTLISTIGIAALLQIEDLCRRRGAGFALAAIPPRQKELFRMLHLAERFRAFDSLEEAVAGV